MFIGYVECEHCGYRTEEFMCLYHHDRGGFHVLVQDQATLALRLVHVPDDDVFYATRAGLIGKEREEAIERYVASVIARNINENEREVPVYDLLQKPDCVRCPQCHEWLVWRDTGIT